MKNLDWSRNVRQISILNQFFWKISKSFIIVEKSQLKSNFLKISILMKISITDTIDEKSLF